MRLEYTRFDGHKSIQPQIFDRETNQVVGWINSEGTGFGKSGGMEVFLFGGKYRRIFDREEKCWAYVKGIEDAINHMISSA